MNPEGGGPTPEEVEQPQQPEAAPTPTGPAQPPRVPPRPRGFWGRIWRRRPERDEELDEDVRQYSQDEQQTMEDRAEQRRAERLENPEEIKTPNTPEELAELLAQMTEGQWRERQIRERYGDGRLWRLKAFLAGERDFELTEDGETRRNAWNEITRKALSVGLKIAPGAAAVGVIGVFTGGIGLPAVGALFGAAGGRGFVEAWHSLNGGERKIREEIARIQYHQWFRLHEMAQSAQEEGISDEQRNERLTQLIDAFHQTNDNIAERQKELVDVQQVWNRRRKIGQLLGGVAGLGAGIWTGFADLSREAMTMDIDGDKVSHLVERVNGDWHYVFNTQQEAIESAVANTKDILNFDFSNVTATHELGESTATVILHAAKNLSGHAAQIGGLMAGLWAGGALARAGGADNEAGRETERVRQEAMAGLERGFQREQVPPPAGPAPAPQEQIRWQEQFESREKPMPAANQVWVIEINGEFGVIRLNEVNFEDGTVHITRLDENLRPMLDQNGYPLEQDYNLQDILNYGSIQENFVANWARQFQPGDQIDLLGYRLLDDRGHEVVNGRYQIDIDAEHANQVVLHHENRPDVHLDGFSLAFFGLNRLTPERQPQAASRERAPRPALNQIIRVINRNNIPENLRDRLPEHFVIKSINTDRERINVFDRGNPDEGFTLTFEQWNNIFPAIEEAGEYTRPQGGGGGQPRGGEGGGRRRGGGQP